jgi:hypothetical protein
MLILCFVTNQIFSEKVKVDSISHMVGYLINGPTGKLANFFIGPDHGRFQ